MPCSGIAQDVKKRHVRVLQLAHVHLARPGIAERRVFNRDNLVEVAIRQRPLNRPVHRRERRLAVGAAPARWRTEAAIVDPRARQLCIGPADIDGPDRSWRRRPMCRDARFRQPGNTRREQRQLLNHLRVRQRSNDHRLIHERAVAGKHARNNSPRRPLRNVASGVSTAGSTRVSPLL